MLFFLQEAKAKYIKLKMEADQHFKDENYERAIEKCTFALEICSIHEFRKEAAELHINLAEIFLKKIPDPQKAFDHAIKVSYSWFFMPGFINSIPESLSEGHLIDRLTSKTCIRFSMSSSTSMTLTIFDNKACTAAHG